MTGASKNNAIQCEDPWVWDVRDHVCDRENSRWPMTYRMINVMCYVMCGMTYSEYFNGSITKKVLPHVAARLRHNDHESHRYFEDKRGRSFKQFSKDLARAFEKIAKSGEIADDVKMRSVYEAPRSKQPQDHPERHPIENGHEAEPLWRHIAEWRHEDRRRIEGSLYMNLCLPFLYQENGIDPSFIDYFLNGREEPSVPVISRLHGVGKFTLVQLYRYTKAELGLELLKDMYAEAKQKDEHISQDEFYTEELQDLVVRHIREVLTLGQATSLLILHSPMRISEMRRLKLELKGIEAALSSVDAKPNDSCCGPEGCTKDDPCAPDRFCSTADSGGCSAQSDECC